MLMCPFRRRICAPWITARPLMWGARQNAPDLVPNQAETLGYLGLIVCERHPVDENSQATFLAYSKKCSS